MIILLPSRLKTCFKWDENQSNQLLCETIQAVYTFYTVTYPMKVWAAEAEAMRKTRARRAIAR